MCWWRCRPLRRERRICFWNAVSFWSCACWFCCSFSSYTYQSVAPPSRAASCRSGWYPPNTRWPVSSPGCRGRWWGRGCFWGSTWKCSSWVIRPRPTTTRPSSCAFCWAPAWLGGGTTRSIRSDASHPPPASSSARPPTPHTPLARLAMSMADSLSVSIGRPCCWRCRAV